MKRSPIPTTDALLDLLRGGDRRSVRGVAEVMAIIERHPTLFAALFQGMVADDPLVRMRAADAAEKLSATSPKRLAPFKRRLLRDVAQSDQQEVRWHVAQMLPRLALTPLERSQAAAILFSYLDDKSSIARTFSLQGLVDLAATDPRLMRRVRPLVRKAVSCGTPAMRSRARRLLPALDRSAIGHQPP